MNARNRTLFLDWEGVLARRLGAPIWDQLYRRYGVPIGEAKSAFQTVEKAYLTGAITNGVFWEQICGRLNIPCDTDILNGLFFQGHTVNEALIAQLQLARRTCYLGVVSNNFDYVRNAVTREYGSRFDILSFSCDTGILKPSTEPFLRASKELNLPLENMVFIDDDQRNIIALEGTGVRTIHFKWNDDSDNGLLMKTLATGGFYGA